MTRAYAEPTALTPGCATIELAPARVDAFGVAHLLDRIDDQFELLAGDDGVRSLTAIGEWVADAPSRVLAALGSVTIRWRDGSSRLARRRSAGCWKRWMPPRWGPSWPPGCKLAACHPDPDAGDPVRSRRAAWRLARPGARRADRRSQLAARARPGGSGSHSPMLHLAARQPVARTALGLERRAA